MESAAILIVDASRVTGRRVMVYLRDVGYEVEWVDTAEKAFNRLDARHFDVLVSEMEVGRVDGMRLMAVAKARNPEVCVVFVTATPDIERATEAMRRGAYDFQAKPLNLEKLEAVIQRGLAYQRLVMEQVALKQRLDEQFGLGSLVGQSRPMLRVYAAVRHAAPRTEPVLLCGEAGTGKDSIAQAIHNGGPRRDGPYVKLDCSVLPKGLLESEIFGAQGQVGRLELADQGTLYIDSIDVLGRSAVRRLRDFVESGVLRRPDLLRGMALDVRIVAARQAASPTEADETLFGATPTIVIEAPPLRARREDLPLLTARMIEKAAQDAGKATPILAPNALAVLTAYDWPGNLRELRSVIDHMVARQRNGAPLDVASLPESVRSAAAPSGGIVSVPVGTPMREIERLAIEATLRACAYNKEQCAKTLGIGLRTLYRKLKEYDAG